MICFLKETVKDNIQPLNQKKINVNVIILQLYKKAMLTKNYNSHNSSKNLCKLQYFTQYYQKQISDCNKNEQKIEQNLQNLYKMAEYSSKYSLRSMNSLHKLDHHEIRQNDDDQKYLKNLKENANKKNNLKKRKIRKQQTNNNKQNQNRNILSNSVHQIFSYLMKQYKSGHFITKIFQEYPHNPSYTISRYYYYQRKLSEKMNYFMKLTSLKLLTAIHYSNSEIYDIEEQHFYMKVSRILAIYYINSEYIPLLLTSKRISHSMKIQHFKNRREILANIKQIFKD